MTIRSPKDRMNIRWRITWINELLVIDQNPVINNNNSR